MNSELRSPIKSDSGKSTDVDELWKEFSLGRQDTASVKGTLAQEVSLVFVYHSVTVDFSLDKNVTRRVLGSAIAERDCGKDRRGRWRLRVRERAYAMCG